MSEREALWEEIRRLSRRLGELEATEHRAAFGQRGIRTMAGSPVGVMTPQYLAEWMRDTTNDRWWMAYGVANDQWLTFGAILQDDEPTDIYPGMLWVDTDA